MSDDTTDPYLWLEDVTGEEQLDWVRARNDRTVEEYTRTESFTDLESRIREILDTDARIPYARRRGEYLYNYWRDAEHVRGLWRRTTMEQYLRDEPEWDVLVDLDAVAEEEGENWVWSGAQVLRPDQTRALISLSRGGADASVIREFDLVERRFVSGPDSFELPEAKTDIGWIDADTVYVGSDFGDGSLTDSGYPRLAKKWRRGTPIEEAETVFEGERTDVAVSAWYDNTPGYERSFVDRAIDFYRAQRFELTADGELVELDVPDDARVSVYRDHLLVRTRSEWLGHPAGTLLAANYPAFLAGSREVTVLFGPDEHTSLEQYAWTQNHLLVVTLQDVQTRVRVLTPGEDGWSDEELPGVPDATSTSIIDVDPLNGDDFFLNSSGFTIPATLLSGTVGGPVEAIKQAPSFFDAEGITVEQFFATSDDGTQVPYFVVGRNTETPSPTLLYGYGGFENSMVPAYSGGVGRAWLEKGYTYVIANIR
ncbi:MAG: S9 family peptidase, partial [Rhodococcus sp. (in: high G+C Gram-positive bacteria)]